MVCEWGRWVQDRIKGDVLGVIEQGSGAKGKGQTFNISGKAVSSIIKSVRKVPR